MAGKGDKPRPTNLKKYRNNYDLIVWSKPKENKNQKKNTKES